LQLIGEPPDDQIATEAQGRSSVMQCPPCTTQLLCRETGQPGDFAIRLSQFPISRSVFSAIVGGETRGRLARMLASRSVVEWGFHRLAGSAMRYTRPRSSLAEARVSPSFFFKVPEKTPRTVWRWQPVTLATSSTVAPSGRRSIAITTSCLEGGLRVGLRPGVRQGLDGRPQLIDQRIAVANFLSLFDIGQSVPQRQQPLGAERSRVQLLIRCNGNLAVVDCCRRRAAQRDPVIANDIDAHEWVLLIDPAAVPP